MSNPWDVKPTDKTPNPWPIVGYAPGNYACRCVLCGRNFFGDKRATNCLECAVQALKSSTDTSQQALWFRAGIEAAAEHCDVWHRKAVDRSDACHDEHERDRHDECAITSGSLGKEILSIPTPSDPLPAALGLKEVRDLVEYLETAISDGHLDDVPSADESESIGWVGEEEMGMTYGHVRRARAALAAIKERSK